MRISPRQALPADPPLLRAENLARLGVGPVELTLGAGECVVITGRSGAGKSVLLRMLADLDPHDGEAWLGGCARSTMRAPDWRRRVTYCPAEPGWWAATVAEHFAARPAAEAQALGLDTAIFDREVALCSTGERQRLALLRALAHDPAVLLLDEPTGALDPQSARAAEALLQARLAQGTALLWVTHDTGQAERLGARHFVMDSGRLLPA